MTFSTTEPGFEGPLSPSSSLASPWAARKTSTPTPTPTTTSSTSVTVTAATAATAVGQSCNSFGAGDRAATVCRTTTILVGTVFRREIQIRRIRVRARSNAEASTSRRRLKKAPEVRLPLDPQVKHSSYESNLQRGKNPFNSF